MAAKPGVGQGAGTLGLVNDLSVKLAKQRKQLNGLVKDVKSATANEMRWYHYAGALTFNNVVVILLGTMFCSWVMGISADAGSFVATNIVATGMQVASTDAALDVVVESPAASAVVSVGAATKSSLQLQQGGGATGSMFSFETSGPEQLSMYQLQRTVPDFAIKPGRHSNNQTDIHITSGSVMVAGALELTGDSMTTYNASLTLRSGLGKGGEIFDIQLAPTGAGRVDVQGRLDVSGSLKVALPGEQLQFTANPADNTLKIGISAEAGSSLRVHGGANLSASGCKANCHRLEGGNLNILNGNMILGNADIATAGDLSVAGNVHFGSFENNTLEIQAAVRFFNSTDIASQAMPKVAIDPIVGSLQSTGQLVVDEIAQLKGSVILGGSRDDRVTIHSSLTTLQKLNASGDANIGTTDSVTELYGDLVVMSSNLSAESPHAHGYLGQPILEINGTHGDVFSDCAMYVRKAVTINGSVQIGSPISNSTIEVEIPADFYGTVALSSNLTVDGESHLSSVTSNECNLQGNLGVGKHGDSFTVGASTGNVYVEGNMAISENANFRSDVVMGQGKRHVTRVGGDTTMKSTLEAHSSFSVNGDMNVDGDLTVANDLRVRSTLSTAGSTYLGDSQKRRSVLTVHGMLRVQSRDMETKAVSATNGKQACEGQNFGEAECNNIGCCVFTSPPGGVGAAECLSAVGAAACETATAYKNLMEIDGGNINIDGRLTVRGETQLEGTTVINSTATVNGRALMEGKLAVEQGFHVQKNMLVGERVEIKEQLTISGNFSADGDSTFGSLEHHVEILGDVLVQSSTPDRPLLLVSATDGVEISDKLSVEGAVQFNDRVDLGPGKITVLATTQTWAPITANKPIDIYGSFTIRDEATVKNGLLVHGSTVLGRRDSKFGDTVKIAGNLMLKDKGVDVLKVDKDTGTISFTSDVHVDGDLNMGLLGTIDTPKFVVGSLKVSSIVERNADQGVTIEGVKFTDGGIQYAHVHEMKELFDTKGVTVEQANCKAGALVLTSAPAQFPQVKNVDVITLTNMNHQENMNDTRTTLAWQQFYHHSKGVGGEDVIHRPADSAAITVATIGDWTLDSKSQNAKMSFETSWLGVRAERAYLDKDGTFRLNGPVPGKASVTLDSAVGNGHISGDVFIGAGNNKCAVPSTGMTSEPFAGAQGQCNVCSACCRDFKANSPTAENPLTSQDKCEHCVQLNCRQFLLNGPRALEIKSEAHASTLDLVAGGSGATSLTMQTTARPDANVPLTSMSFVNVAKTSDSAVAPRALKLVDDSDRLKPVDVFVLTARKLGDGTVGDLYVSGSFLVGDKNTTQKQYLKQSVGSNGGNVELKVQSGMSHQTSVVIESGPDQYAILKLTDPGDGEKGSGFWILNDGTQGRQASDKTLWEVGPKEDCGLHTMRISDPFGHSLLSVHDQGTVGSLVISGDLSIGSFEGDSNRVLKVISSAAAALDVISGGGSDALVSITAGPHKQPKVVLADSTNAYFSLSTSMTSRTLMIAQGVLPSLLQQDTPATEFGLVNLTVSNASIGKQVDMQVSGSAHFGCKKQSSTDPTTCESPSKEPVTLAVVSGGRAELGIVAGDGEHDAAIQLVSGPNKVTDLTLAVESLKEGQQPGDEHQNMYDIHLINDGARNGVDMLQIVHGEDDKASVLGSITDKGTFGDLVISGDATFGAADASALRSLQIKSPARADLIVSSGELADGVLQLESTAGSAITLEDTGEQHVGTFKIISKSSDAAMHITDHNGKMMLALHDRGTEGDIEATGDVAIGEPSAQSSRSMGIHGTKGAYLDILAGDGSDSEVKLGAGVSSTASFQLGTENTTGFYMYAGSSKSKSLRVAVPRPIGAYGDDDILVGGDSVVDLLNIVDRGRTGDLEISGDVLVGGADAKKKELRVVSAQVSKLDIHAGDFADGVLHLQSGLGKTAMISLQNEESVPSQPGAKATAMAGFDIQIGADASTNDPALFITDGTNGGKDQDGNAVTQVASQMMAIYDRGSEGDLVVTGNGVIGDTAATEVLDNSITVRGAPGKIDVIAGKDDSGTLSIRSGKDQMAKMKLSTHIDGAYEFVNVGEGDNKRLDVIHLNGSDFATPIMHLTDLGTTGQLAFVGDVEIGSINSSVPVAMTVGDPKSTGKALIEVHAGSGFDSTIALTSGANRKSTLSLISAVAGPAGDVRFDMVLDGAGITPALQFKHDSTTVMSIEDSGALTPTKVNLLSLRCASYSTGKQGAGSHKITFGDSSNDQILIRGHITNPELNFDGNGDGVMLKLKFEDPQKPTIVVFPDESGTVLTSASSNSELKRVGALKGGEIVEGFGKIVTAASIETIGKGSQITSAGTFTANSIFKANGNTEIGDDKADKVTFRGVVQGHFKFKPGTGLKFMGNNQKATFLKASFEPTDSDKSPAGARQIMIPDVPTGGSLHVVANDAISGEVRQVSNVMQVSVDATAGKLTGPQNLAMGPMESATFHLVNRRIQRKSIVLCMVTDDESEASGGWIIVTAVKVNVNGAGCSIVITNIHPTQSVPSGTKFSVVFSVF